MANSDRIRFATFFPGTFFPGSDIHLLKDVGMIPYILHREYGYDVWLIAYPPAKDTVLKNAPEGLNMLWIWKGPGFHAMKLLKKILKYDSSAYLAAEALCVMVDAFPVMLRHGRRFDVLQLYHFKPESMLAAFVFRLFNRRGLVYMKLDMDPNIINVYRDDPGKKDTIGLKISRYLFKRLPINIFSVESKRVYEFMRADHPLFKDFSDRVIYIPNGVDVKGIPAQSGGEKENIVLHAGRACNPQKRTGVILEAFARVAKDFPDWKLALVGPMDTRYKGRFDDFMRQHKSLNGRIDNVGFLEDRKDVFGWYRRAKILAIPSAFESFGLVVVEAQLFGDIVLGSDIPAVRELTDNGEFSYLCPVDDVDCFEKKLRYMMSHEEELVSKAKPASAFIRRNFDWTAICGDLHRKISEGLKCEKRS
jgi:glycosyltransferase involved in cell wall biosynthesis